MMHMFEHVPSKKFGEEREIHILISFFSPMFSSCFVIWELGVLYGVSVYKM